MRRILLIVVTFACASSSSLLGATVTRGPYLQSSAPESIVVRWRTDVQTDSRVLFGLVQGALSSNASDALVTTEHVVTLTGLSADTKYYYSVGSGTVELAGNDAGHFFVTPPAPGSQKPTRIWVLGDPGTANSNARAVRDAYYNFTGSRHTDLWLMLGDNAYDNGTDAQFQVAVFDTYPTMLAKSALWSCLGNHETNQSTVMGPYAYFQIFTFPTNAQAGGLASGTENYYSFDYGNIHFISLDSQISSRAANGAMAGWLSNDLAATNKTWIIAFFHHPCYSKGSHNSDTDPQSTEMRQNIQPILEAGGVDLVLNGHSHDYERSYLLNGHYGTSVTFAPGMKKDGGDGRPTGNGAYDKASGSNQGAVYTVAGSSGKVSTSGAHNHPAVFMNLVELGSLVLDVDGGRLDARFISSTGSIDDTFTMLKGPVDIQPPSAPILAVMTNPDASATLTWTTSTDNVGVAAYKIYRDGFEIGTSLTTSFNDPGLIGLTSYTYKVKAQDMSGNRSPESNAVTVMTSAIPGVIYWVGPASGGSWNDAANWSSNPILPSATDDVSFPGSMTAAIVSLDGNQAVRSLTISAEFGSSLTLNSGGDFTLSIGSGGLINAAPSGNMNADLVLTAASTLVCNSGCVLSLGNVNNGGFAFTVKTSGACTISGVISGAGALTKTGAEALTLSGVNTFSGSPLRVNGGRLIISSDSALGASTNTLSFTAAALQLNGTFTLSRAISLSGGFTTDVPGLNSVTLAGAISGTSSLTKNGAGTLLLSTANTFQGSIAVNGGILRSGANNAFSGLSAQFPLSVEAGAILDTNGFLNEFSDLNLNGGTIQTGTGKIELHGASITATSQNGQPSVISGNLDLGGSDRPFVVEKGEYEPDLLVSAVMQNTTGTVAEKIIKSGGGMMVISGANTYIQQTRVDEGVLELAGNSGSIANSASLTLNGGVFRISDLPGVDIDRIGDTMPIFMNGGTFAMTAPSDSDRTETVGLITFGGGFSTISLTAAGIGNCRLTMNSALVSPLRNGTATFNLMHTNALQPGTGSANLYYSSGGLATVTSFCTVNGGPAIYDGIGAAGLGLVEGTPENVPPTTPGNLSVLSVTDTTVTISWSASSDNVAVTNYRVLRNGVQIATPPSTTYTDSGLSPLSSYTYQVCAEDPAGNISPLSNTVMATTIVSSLLISKLSTWKYLDIGADQGVVWRDPAFDDSGWSSGPATLGYGNNPADATVLNFGPDASNKFPTTYFRKAFNVTDRTQWNALRFSIMFDDGAVVYLNGAELSRFNLPQSGTISYGTTASPTVSGTVTAYTTLPGAFANTLVNGSNVVAVEIHQSSGTSSDIRFDFELQGIVDNQAPTIPTNLTPTYNSTTSISFNWTASTDDNVKVTYVVFRNGAMVGNTSATTFTDSGLSPSTMYSYTVKAKDVAGNLSADSSALAVSTSSPQPTTVTWVGPATGGSWNDPGNWSTAAVPAGQLVVFPSTMSSAVITLDASQSVESLSLNSLPLGSITINPNGAFSLTVGAGGIVNHAPSTVINSNLNLFSACTIAVDASTTLGIGKLNNAGFMLTVDSAGICNISDVISGTAGLIKLGGGTLVLGGANTYSGATQVQAGTLQMTGSLDVSAGLTSVSAGATLTGSGSVRALNSAGTVSPGNGIGTLFSGDTTFATGSTLLIQIPSSANHDTLDLSSATLSIQAGTTLSVDLSNLGSGTAQEFVVAQYASATPIPFNLIVLNNAFNQSVAVSYKTTVMPHQVLVAIGTAVTPATVDSLQANVVGAGVLLEWEALSEFKNAGFNLYRRPLDSFEWTRINPTLIPGRITNAEEKTYRHYDWPLPGDYQYKLESVCIDGSLGNELNCADPVRLDWFLDSDNDARSLTRESIDAVLESIHEKQRAAEANALGARVATINTRGNAKEIATKLRTDPQFSATAPIAASSHAAGVRWFSGVVTGSVSAFEAAKVSYRAPGVMLIPKAALPAGYDGDHLALQREGRGISALAVNQSGILVYVQGYQDDYTDKDALFLRRSRGATSVMPVAPQSDLFASSQMANVVSPAKAAVSFHDVYFDYNQRPYNFPPWFSNQYLTNGSLQQFSVDTPGAVGNTAMLTLNLWSLTQREGLPFDHALQVLVNKQPAGECVWSGGSKMMELTFRLEAGVLHNGPNLIELVTPQIDGLETQISFLHSITIDYTRALSASTVLDIFNYGDKPMMFEIGDLSSANPWIVDARFSDRATLVPYSTQPQAEGTYKLRFMAASGGTGHYVCVPQGQENLPISVARRQVKPTKSSAYLATGPSQFGPAVQPLLAKHAREGIGSAFVDQEQLFDYYNHGRYGPFAIQNAVRASKPKYLLLLGRTTYDYRNYSGLNVDPLCPTFLVSTSFWAQATSDSNFGDMGRGYPEVAVGRLPANNPAELSAAIKRILGYAGAPPSGIRIHGVADRPDPIAGDFGAQIDLLAENNSELSWQKNYLGTTFATAPETSAALKTAANGGADWIIYVGHGNSVRLGKEAPRILDVEQVQDWTGEVVLLQSTCTAHWMAKNEAGFKSIAIQALTQPQGGIAASIGTSTYMNSAIATEFMNTLIANASKNGRRWGDALLLSQQWAGAKGSGFYNDLNKTEQLFGDPAMRVFVAPIRNTSTDGSRVQGGSF